MIDLTLNKYKNCSQAKDFFALLKPRVMSLVVFMAICGMMLAPGKIHPLLGGISILCIAIGSGAAGALNMWYERDIDALMRRTQSRPLPKQSLTPEDALHFSVLLAAFSIILLGLAVNILSACLLAFAIGFYVFVYTIWLKSRTCQNIVIGGAAGAMPPLIGWAAVTNEVSLFPLLLVLIIFMWTPPHFWALSLYSYEDYKRANIPMMPIVKGEKFTKLNILIYSIILVICSILPVLYNYIGYYYLIVSLILGVRFIYYAIAVYNNNKYAPALFGYSIIYLFMLFSAMLIDKGLS